MHIYNFSQAWKIEAMLKTVYWEKDWAWGIKILASPMMTSRFEGICFIGNFLNNYTTGMNLKHICQTLGNILMRKVQNCIYISWVQAGYGRYSSSWWSMTISISVDFLLIFYFIDWISWIQLCIYTALADGVWQFQFLLIEVLMWRLCNWITLLGEKKAKSLFVIWSRSFVH